MSGLGAILVTAEGFLANVEGAGGVRMVQGSSDMIAVAVGGWEGGDRGLGSCCWELTQNHNRGKKMHGNGEEMSECMTLISLWIFMGYLLNY